MILGSVTTALLRTAPCWVLSVPDLAVARPTTGEAIPALSTESVARGEFSRRNGGQRCGLEVHASGDGAHLLGSGLDLIGADFDEHDEAVTLMFGAAVLDGPHFTHVVRPVRGIDRLADADGLEQGLSIVGERDTTVVGLLDSSSAGRSMDPAETWHAAARLS
jgi:hypothetical protein